MKKQVRYTVAKEVDAVEVSLNEKITLSISEAAIALGVSRPTVYQLIHRADFPSFKIGTRTVIPRQALEKWAEEQARSKV